MNHRKQASSDWPAIWGLVAVLAVGSCIDVEAKLKQRDAALIEAKSEALKLNVTIDVLRRQLMGGTPSASEPIEEYKPLIPPAEDLVPIELRK